MANCEQCNQTFAAIRDWQRFCSTTCQQAWNRHHRKMEAVKKADQRAWLRKHPEIEIEKIDLGRLGILKPELNIKRRRL